MKYLFGLYVMLVPMFLGYLIGVAETLSMPKFTPAYWLSMLVSCYIGWRWCDFTNDYWSKNK